MEQWISSAEAKCGELDYRSPLDKTRAQLAILTGLVQKITDTESGFTNHLSLRNDLLERSAAVEAKFSTYGNELQKLDQGTAAIQKARTIKDFSDGINLIVSSEFSASPVAMAASSAQSLNASDETILRGLLDATNAATWAFIGKAQPVQLFPEVAMPAERQILQQLSSDPAVGSIHQRYRLWLDQEGKSLVEWITAGALDSSEGWKQIPAWTPSTNATSATFEAQDYGCFNNQYKLSPTQPIYRVEQLENPDETVSFGSVGLEKVATGGDSYAKPLLEVLDSIKNSHEGSPLFRAYLFLRLMDLMKLQPDAWGLTFCPAARADEAQIRTIIGEKSLNSGDWFVPAKVNAFSQKLEQFFASVKSVSYTKQASGLLTLARTISKGNFQYVGFVGMDGKPNLADSSLSGEVFGYGAASRQPVLLSAKIESGQSLKEPAVPLSPLFAFDGSRKEYLEKAGINPDDISLQGALPPMYKKPSQP